MHSNRTKPVSALSVVANLQCRRLQMIYGCPFTLTSDGPASRKGRLRPPLEKEAGVPDPGLPHQEWGEKPERDVSKLRQRQLAIMIGRHDVADRSR